MKKSLHLIFILNTLVTACLAQGREEVPVKISHAGPIFVDLIRDLGAHRGEKELNVGMGMLSIDKQIVNSYLVEYEFAPINSLGMEVEIPLIFHHTYATADGQGHETNGLKESKWLFNIHFLFRGNLKLPWQ